MENKKRYGQYYTTNCDYILSDITAPKGFVYVEPFVGQGDLVKWTNGGTWECYDIDPKIKADTRDSLLRPPDYKDKFIITNPPFLAKNKNKDKSVYLKYGVDDLYKAAIKSFVLGDAAGGILIVPLNFLCDRDKNIRNLFFEKYSIEKVNVFEETVFDDTTYTVCSFRFFKKSNTKSIKIKFKFFPKKKTKAFVLKKEHGWKVGGEVFEKPNPKSSYSLSRLIKGEKPDTSIYLRAIDTGAKGGRIKLFPHSKHYYDCTKNKSERCFATIKCNIPIKDEVKICKEFNKELERYRKKYNSLFLTNYRNSTSNYSRKRLSFKQCFVLLEKILVKYNK